MNNLNDLSSSQHLKVLVYGDSGVGKTCSIATMPGPIFMFDFDQKISSLASFLKVSNKEKLKEVDYDAFGHDPTKKGRPIQRFEGSLVGAKKAIEAGEFKYKTVVLDSLTTFAEELMREIIKNNPGLKRAIENVPSLQDYMVLNIEFKRIVNQLLSLPLNVVVIAHASTDKDENTGQIKVKPLLPGKLADQLPVVFPELYRAFVAQQDGKSSFLLQTRPDGKHIARTQIPSLGAIIPNQLGDIIKQLNS
jgi:phage nucleotide-binding protein